MGMEKNMNARIQHKHDIEANWNKALNFIPKIGEIIVYDIDENYNYSRFKIGDGVRTISNLEFSETDLTGYATEKYVDEAITSLDAAFKILGKDPNGFGISVKAADNKTVIEALGEAGAGLYTLYVQKGVSDNPTGTESSCRGIACVNTWYNKMEFYSWILLFDDESNLYTRYMNGVYGPQDWQKVTYDLSNYATKSYVNEGLATKQDKITGTAGDFVIIGEDGNVTTKTIPNAEEATF